MNLLGTKELAARLGGVHVRTAKRWWKRLKVPPLIGGHASHKWSEAQVKKLVTRWTAYWRRRGFDPRAIVAKWSGADKRANDKRQLRFKF